MITTTRLFSRRIREMVCFVATLLLAGTAHAALIPQFGLDEFPNFTAIDLVVGYDSDTDTLLAVGVNDVDLGLGGEFGIDTIDGTGFKVKMNNPANAVRAPSGTISITGMIPEMGFTSGTLLTGDIIDFGWIEQGDPESPYELEIVFAITGGDAAALFGPTGAIGFTQTDFPGDWTKDWVNSGDGETITATYAPVPLPGALLLLGSGLLGLVRRRFRS